MSASEKKFRCQHPDCMYRATREVSSPEWGCNYSAITGKTKLGQVPGHRQDPRDCIFYAPGEREQPRVDVLAIPPRVKEDRPMVRKSRPGPKYDWEGEARRLWEAGKSDREVAEIMGCGVTYAGKMRRQMDMLSKQKKASVRYRLRPDQMKQLHAAGLNDEQIARRMKCTPPSVRSLRQDLHLAPNGNKIRDQDKAQEIFNTIMKEDSHAGL